VEEGIVITGGRDGEGLITDFRERKEEREEGVWGGVVTGLKGE